jgi:hypothetical protein
MLVTHLKKVAEIDNQIVAMHHKLADLYQRRMVLIDGDDGLSTGSLTSGTAAIINSSTIEMSKVEQAYRQLASAWERYGIVIPAWSKLRQKLEKGEKIKAALIKNYPEIATGLSFIAIPPTAQLKLPVAESLRKLQLNADYADFISRGVTIPGPQKNWRLLLAHTAPDSLHVGSAKKAHETKVYMAAGYDLRALGVREYAAMSLQLNGAVDTRTSTILLKNHRSKTPVPYARFRFGHYRFELEDDDNVLDDDGFRPSIEL